MNKKGFTLVELLAVVIIMSLIMAFAFPAITSIINSNNQKKYEAYEKSMTEYAKAYFDDSRSTIGLTSLKKQGLTGIEESCIGYVDASNNFKAYLKCGENYKTEGFNSSNAS